MGFGFFCFVFFHADDVQPSDSQQTFSLPAYVKSFQQHFSYHLDPCAAPSHYCDWAYACVYGSQLHVGPLSPSHTSGAGRGTEHPEGLNFPQLPIPSLLSLFLCLLAFQEDASQVLGNMCAALLPFSTYTLPFSSRLHFHISAPHFSLFGWLCFTSTLHVFVPNSPLPKKQLKPP